MENLIDYIIDRIENRTATPDTLIAELKVLKRILATCKYDFEKKKIIDAFMGVEDAE